MSSGPSHILVLSQIDGSANVVPAWREFIGPADTEEARREKPERLVMEIKAFMCSIHTRKSSSSGTETDEVIISVSREGETFV